MAEFAPINSEEAGAVHPRLEIEGRAHGRSSFFRWLGGRLLAATFVLVAVSILIFAATSILPGDAARAYLGPRATPEQLETIRAQMGIDRPWIEQYTGWATSALRGDFGESLISQRDIREAIARPLRNSIALGTITVLLLVPLTVSLGLISGLKADSLVDTGIGAVALLAYAIPMFITATMLVYLLALRWGLLPAVSLLPSGASPWRAPDVIAIPMLTLLAGSSAYFIRLTRASTIGVMRSEFVEAAVLRGVGPARLLVHHILPSVLPPIVQVLVLYIAALLGGVIIVETTVGYPGIGLELTRAIAARDIPLVQAIAMLSASAMVFGNVIADAAVIALTPRLRAELWS